MSTLDLNQSIKPHHLAPLLSALIVIGAYLTRSDAVQGTLFLLNVVALPFLTGVAYVCSIENHDRDTWTSISLGSWPTVAFILIVDLLLGLFYLLYISPIFFIMGSLGAIITQFVRLKFWPRS
jgi:hypothetical protein